MTRWCNRFVVLIGSILTTTYVLPSQRLARPVDEHVGSRGVIRPKTWACLTNPWRSSRPGSP